MKERTIESWIGHARSIMTDAGIQEDRPHGHGDPAFAAVIAAADLPVAPSALFGCASRDIYDIRTVAGLVPPSAGEDADRSVGAALEFAVRVRGIGHIILLAHPDCGLVRCLIDRDAPGADAVLQGQFLPSWTSIAASSLSRILHAKIPEDERAAVCSQEIVRVSFENLMTYQWILDAVFGGRLQLHGWYVDPAKGIVLRFDPDSDEFLDG